MYLQCRGGDAVPIPDSGSSFTGVESPELSPSLRESSVDDVVDEWSSSEQSEIHVKLDDLDSAGDVCVPISETSCLLLFIGPIQHSNGEYI